jgi:hypothetical protein
VTEIENLTYSPATPGNLLDLHLPDVPGNAALPLVIWHSGSAWFSNTAKDTGEAATVAAEFTARGYAVDGRVRRREQPGDGVRLPTRLADAT